MINHNTGYTVANSLNISQGSVATNLTCGGIFNDDFIANLLFSLSVKSFSAHNFATYGQWYSSTLF